MTKLHFLRHAPTHSKNFVGWTDLPADLSDTRIQDRIRHDIPEDAICISSDLIRCVTTLDTVAGGRDILLADKDLREFNFGDWEDKHHSEVTKSHPELAMDYWSNPGSVAAPNGDSWDSASSRISSAVDRIVTDHGSKDILICCHFGAILTQLARYTNMPAKTAFGFKIDNYSLTTIEVLGPQAARVLRVNHVL